MIAEIAAGTFIVLFVVGAIVSWRLMARSNAAGFSAFDQLRFRIQSTPVGAYVSDPDLWLGAGFLLLIAASLGVLALLLLDSRSAGASDPIAYRALAQSPPRSIVEPTATLVPVPYPDTVSVEIVRTDTMAWPAPGQLTGLFGGAGGNGIEITLDANRDVEILATMGGIVTFAGGDSCCGLGYYVVIDHENGLTSTYGHLSELLVPQGQRLYQGVSVGLGGRTGGLSSKRLYFQVSQGGVPLDPLNFLPLSQSGQEPPKHDYHTCPNQAIQLDPWSTVSLTFLLDWRTNALISRITVTPDFEDAPTLVARPGGAARIELIVPPNPQGAKGIDYAVSVVLAQRGQSMEITCHLSLATASAVPRFENLGPLTVVPAPAVVVPSAVLAPPPAATAQPVIGRPTSTPTPQRSPTPTRTRTPIVPTAPLPTATRTR